MNNAADNESIAPEVNDSVLTGISAVTDYGLDYFKSKAALAALEAKVAATSITLMIILGLFSVVMLCAAWGLGCFAIAQWLTLSGLMSSLQALGVVIIINFIALAIALVSIFKLSKSLLFVNTLNKPTNELETI